jgi:hypothetical protein
MQHAYLQQRTMKKLEHLLNKRIQQCHVTTITQSNEIIFSVNEAAFFVN